MSFGLYELDLESNIPEFTKSVSYDIWGLYLFTWPKIVYI